MHYEERQEFHNNLFLHVVRNDKGRDSPAFPFKYRFSSVFMFDRKRVVCEEFVEEFVEDFLAG